MRVLLQATLRQPAGDGIANKPSLLLSLTVDNCVIAISADRRHDVRDLHWRLERLGYRYLSWSRLYGEVGFSGWSSACRLD